MLKFDFNNLFEDRIGDKGITDAEFEKVLAMAGKMHEGIEKDRPNRTWRELPYAKKDLIDSIKETAEYIRGNFESFIVVGIGGSALGARALFSGLMHPKHNELPKEKRNAPKFYVTDNVDPDGLNAILDVIDIKKTAINVISKSGNTVETMSQFMMLMGKMQEAGVEDLKDRIYITTDKNSGILRKIVNAYGFKSFEVPDGTGGRFSVLSEVGLLPAAVLGISIDELFRGAADMDKLASNPDVYKNPAYMYALTHYAAMKKGMSISLMMPYSDRLYNLALWYVQLWAESLGKKFNKAGETVNVGQTPMAALGVTDQHSSVQLFTEGPYDKITTFIGVEEQNTKLDIPCVAMDMQDANYLKGQNFGKLFASERDATEYAFKKENRASLRIRMDKVTEYNLASVMYMFEVAVSAMGQLMEIDAFDQPGVEAGKIATFAYMGREGYEEKLKELTAPLKSDEKLIIEC